MDSLPLYDQGSLDKAVTTIITVLFPGRDFPGASVVKNLPANAGDAGSISGSGKSPGEGYGNPL